MTAPRPTSPSAFLIDPAVVGAFLDKPCDLREAWEKAATAVERTALTPPAPGQTPYTDTEKDYARAEAVRLYDAQVSALPPAAAEDKRLVLSAGGPGAGKSTLLENLLKDEPEFLGGLVFADPDERALKLMTAFLADIENYGGGRIGLALSYTKWRWASNYISGTIMNRACAEGRGILHGTTATSPQVAMLYDNARRAGYDITTVIVAAPQSVREESARRRFEEEQTRYTADTAIKGRQFYERLPLLLEKTDHFRLYWRTAAQSAPVLAASGAGGAVTVHDRNALRAAERDAAAIDPGLSWKRLEQVYQAAP